MKIKKWIRRRLLPVEYYYTGKKQTTSIAKLHTVHQIKKALCCYMRFENFAECEPERGERKREVGEQQIAIKMKINVYNWHHWNGTEAEDMLWSWKYGCMCADVVGGCMLWYWDGSVNGCCCNRKARMHAFASTDFVINLFERLTRIYFWQTNFYLYRQSRKACAFAKNTHTKTRETTTAPHYHYCGCRRRRRHQNRKMKHTFSILVSVCSILRRGKPFRLKYLLK